MTLTPIMYNSDLGPIIFKYVLIMTLSCLGSFYGMVIFGLLCFYMSEGYKKLEITELSGHFLCEVLATSLNSL